MNHTHRIPDSQKYRPHDQYSVEKAKQQMTRPADDLQKIRVYVTNHVRK